MRARFLTLVASSLALLGLGAACGTSTETSSGGSSPGPAASCVADAGADPPYKSEATGTLSGAAVGASLCGVLAEVYATPYTHGTSLVFQLSGGASGFTSPTGARAARVTGLVAVGAAKPGVYSSTTSGACGSLVVSFELPMPAGVDCDAGTAPNCPAHCAAVCSSFGCEPCAPQPPMVDYQASAAADCLGDGQKPEGDWTLTLTSVAPTPDDAGPSDLTHYLVHGSFVASLAGSDGASAALSLSF